MKKTELKQILKPLIKQCIHEALIEEGLLSNIVSEVVKGFSPLMVENKQSTQPRYDTDELKRQQALLEEKQLEAEEDQRRTLKEQKRKVLNAAGFGDEIFKGVQPLTNAGAVGSEPQPGSLAGTDPNDAGVDISGIMALGGPRWNKMI